MKFTKFRTYLEKVLAALRVRTFIGGMEVSDVALRFVYFDGEAWRMSGMRLEPGVIESGKIKKYDQLVATLKTLKSKVFGQRGVKRKINVIVSLGSINIYSQVFSLPIIEGENLDKAIKLNVQMVSPMETSQAYSGWQLVGKDQESLRLEILSAFIDRSTVDETSRAFWDAGFLIVVMEPRALALARVLREEGEGFDMRSAYIMVGLDNSGLDFLIIRRGQLYFEYFIPWRDVMDDKGQISMPTFEAIITRSLHQVMNFYSQHWPEPISEVVLSTIAFSKETTKIINDNFTLTVRELKLRTVEGVSQEWFIALGCGLRGLKPRSKDKDISLLDVGAEEEFRRERLITFTDFWRLLTPVSLGFLLALFLLADLFLIQTHQSLESQSLFGLGSKRAKENQALQAQAADFNRSVAMIKSVQDATFLQGKFLEKIRALMASSGLTLNKLTFRSPGFPVSLSGLAGSEDQIVSFKKALEEDPAFGDVDLPLSGIRSGPGGPSFSMTFQLQP